MYKDGELFDASELLALDPFQREQGGRRDAMFVSKIDELDSAEGKTQQGNTLEHAKPYCN